MDYLFTDLHLHSSFSDEDLCDETPKHILGKVQGYVDKFNTNNGTNVQCCISIADHNSVLGSVEAKKLVASGLYPNVRFITGCEFTTDLVELNHYVGVENCFTRCHLLAYNYDESDRELIAYSKIAHKRFSNEDNVGLQICAARRLICEKYKVFIPFSEFESLASLNKSANYNSHFVQIVKAYFEKNNIEFNLDDVKYLTSVYLIGASVYKEEATSFGRIKLSEAMKLVGDAGGTLVLAHPTTIRVSLDGIKLFLNNAGLDGEQEVEKLKNKKGSKGKRLALLQLNNEFAEIILKEFLQAGEYIGNGVKIEGLETFIGVNYERRRDVAIKQVCQTQNLFCSCGSDYHGENFTTHKTIGNVFQQSFQREFGIKNCRLQDRNLFVRVSNMPLLKYFNGEEVGLRGEYPSFIDENFVEMKWDNIDNLIKDVDLKHKEIKQNSKKIKEDNNATEIQKHIGYLTSIAEKYNEILDKSLNYKKRRELLFKLDQFVSTIIKSLRALQKDVREHSEYYKVEDVKRLTTLLKEIHRKYYEMLRLDSGIIRSLKSSLSNKGIHRSPVVGQLATITIKQNVNKEKES